MAKNQSRKPGRDVRGGTGKRQEKIAPTRGGTSRVERTQAKRAQAASARGPRRDDAPRKPQHRQGASTKADMVIGRRAAAEALSAGIPIKSALVQNITGERDAALEALVKQLEAEDVQVERVPKGKLDALAEGGAHQGIVLRARPFEYAELADVIDAAGDRSRRGLWCGYPQRARRRCWRGCV